MDDNEKRFELVSKNVIRALEARNMQGFYTANREEARKLALSFIHDGAVVGFGGSASVDEIGLKEALTEKGCALLDWGQEDMQKVFRDVFSAEFYVCSTNAISEDGVLVNIDGTSNRIAAIAFGPKNVIMIVGRNKLVKTEEDARRRAKYIAAPVNAVRIGTDTPCAETGTCYDCRKPRRVCCNELATYYSRLPGRIKVILVNENLGF